MIFLEFVESLTDDELGRIFRASCLAAGFSDQTVGWEELPPHRKTPHIKGGTYFVSMLCSQYFRQESNP